MTENNNAHKNVNGAAAKADLQPGEKVFTVILFAVTAFLFYRSILLWQTAPGISGPAMLPLLSSGLAALLLAASIAVNIWKTTPVSGKNLTFPQKTSIVLVYLFSKNVVITIIFIFAYCVLLNFRVSFYLSSALFLWGLMSFLAKGGFVKNIIWTAMVLAFIAVVFGMLFSVVMP
ncbi:hypothetical protein [Synergistes jonesii]|uniref:hypothetical protein n=1 Tax=Synergistes jonesii TaxID=2754 RepID=UPI00248D536A|nr:hypothetical protein [Synergistes jonesii]